MNLSKEGCYVSGFFPSGMLSDPGCSIDILCIYQHAADDQHNIHGGRQKVWVTLARCLAGLPQRNLLLLGGDFNCAPPPLSGHSGPGHCPPKITEQMLQRCRILCEFTTYVFLIPGARRSSTICILFRWVVGCHKLITYSQDDCMQTVLPDNLDRCGGRAVWISRRGGVVLNTWQYNAISHFFLDGGRPLQSKAVVLVMTNKRLTTQYDTIGPRRNNFGKQFSTGWKEQVTIPSNTSMRHCSMAARRSSPREKRTRSRDLGKIQQFAQKFLNYGFADAFLMLQQTQF